MKNFSEDEQKKLTARAKSLLFAFSIIGAFLYYGLYKFSGGKIAVLFFVIFSSSLSLLPSLMYALFNEEKAKKLRLSLVSTLSIFIGYFTPLLLVIYSFFRPELNLGFVTLTNDSFYTYGPFFAIGLSNLIFFTGLFLKLKSQK